MTPNEKSKELVAKFELLLGTNADGVVAAEACCDEIIAALQQSQRMSVSSGEYMYQFEYWQSVKREIEKM